MKGDDRPNLGWVSVQDLRKIFDGDSATVSAV